MDLYGSGKTCSVLHFVVLELEVWSLVVVVVLMILFTDCVVVVGDGIVDLFVTGNPKLITLHIVAAVVV